MNQITSNSTFERLKKEDINYIKYLEDEQNISILSLNTIQNELKTSLTSNYFVVKYLGIIIAYVNFELILDTIELNSIVVKKDYQRKKVASFIFDNLFQICKEKNIKKIILEVRTSNTKAQNLYKKYGFKKISIRKKYYPDNLEDAIIYEYTF